MRLLIFAALFAAFASAPVMADRVIFAPTGMTLSPGEVKAEAATSPSADNSIVWGGVGMQKLEVDFIKLGDGAPVLGAIDTSIVNAQAGILPETTLTPGVAVGVWDFNKKTEKGRGYFLAVSKAVPLLKELPLPLHDLKVHAGIGTKGVDGLFGGAEATLPMGVRVSGEYFYDQFNFALGWQLIPKLELKGYLLDGETYYGVKFKMPL